ncbi:MAG: poly(ADP-ribose) glycohydrolase domain-containing protein, partial [Chloroflexota bacterium]
MSLKGVAKATIQILEEGRFTNSAGQIVDFASEQQAAVLGTVLYTPDQLAALLDEQPTGEDTKSSTV